MDYDTTARLTLMLNPGLPRSIVSLASGVAHNFNNLLQVIMARVELALTNLESGDTRTLKEYFGAN